MNLLQTARELENYTLLAADGEISHVVGFYFDDMTWAIRYLIVDADGLLTGRYVVISPIAIGEVNDEQKTITIELTCGQIKNSPPISKNRPISRQYELEYYQYYNWIPYWELGPSSDFPISGASMTHSPVLGDTAAQNTEEKHLHSTSEANGYKMNVMDGEIGHVKDFIIDTRYWVIRYLEIDTGNWWPGKHILVNTGWIEGLSWTGQTVSVGLTREAINKAPGFDPSKIISRDYEIQLFKHYGRPVYWRR